VNARSPARAPFATPTITPQPLHLCASTLMALRSHPRTSPLQIAGCVCVCVLVGCTWSPSRRNPRASPWSVESADPTTPTMPHASAKCSLPPRPQRPRPTDAAAAAGRWDELRRRRNILAAVSDLEVLEQLIKMRSTVNLPCFPTDKSAGVKKAKKRWCVAVLLPEWSSPKIENRNRSRTTGYW